MYGELHIKPESLFTKAELLEWMEYYEKGGELEDEEMCKLFDTALFGLSDANQVTLQNRIQELEARLEQINSLATNDHCDTRDILRALDKIGELTDLSDKDNENTLG